MCLIRVTQFVPNLQQIKKGILWLFLQSQIWGGIKVTRLQISNPLQIERYQRLSGSYGFLISLITRLEKDGDQKNIKFKKENCEKID